jgi:23S rRNA (adenine1618-N6)-methyltransferase
MEALCKAHPQLSKHIVPAAQSKGNKDTINFSDRDAIRSLNTALLVSDYGVTVWDFPSDKLCPPIPGRADYIHHLADVLRESCGDGTSSSSPIGANVRGFDVGTGSTLIYPILGAASYGWSFLASESDPLSLASAQAILKNNAALPGLNASEVRFQPNPKSQALLGILESSSSSSSSGEGEVVDFVICNPPFYPSAEAFEKANARKRTNLDINKARRSSLIPSATPSSPAGSNNFGGEASELWTPGGEIAFVQRLIEESQSISHRCMWFSSLVSRHVNFKPLQASLDSRQGVCESRIVQMGQGQKRSNILLWTFLNKEQRRAWSIRRGWNWS